MKQQKNTQKARLLEIEDLRIRLEEAQETLSAIRRGEVDGLIVSGPDGDRVYTLKGAGRPYRFFVEAMNEGAATLSLDGTILYCNDRFAEMAGAPHQKIIGDSIYPFIASSETFDPAFQKGKTESSKTQILLKKGDNSFIPVSLSFNPMREEEVPGVCMVVTDLTEQKRLEEDLRQMNVHLEEIVRDRTAELTKTNEALRIEIIERRRAEEVLRENEKRLRESEEKARNLIAHAPTPIYETDITGTRFLSVNDTVCELSGYSREEFLAMSPMDVVDQASKVAFQDRVRRKLSGEEVNEGIEYKVIAKDGRALDLAVRNVSFGYQDGKPESVLVIAHDITERKRMEEALRQRTLELQDLNDTLEQRVQERTEELEVLNEELREEVDECQRVELELKKSESDLRQLSLEILNAQEKERKAVAGEIHDSIGSSLSAIKFKVELALTELTDECPKMIPTLKSIVPIVQGAIDEARRIQMNLRPPMLDDLGILATVSWFCRQFESNYSKIRVMQTINIEERDVPASLKTVIFRVLQEGLNNVAKHSGTEVVFLYISKSNQTINLTIRDYGQGFDLSKQDSQSGTPQRLGLKNMRERIELSGGSFKIESAEGHGTTIRASWLI